LFSSPDSDKKATPIVKDAWNFKFREVDFKDAIKKMVQETTLEL